MKKIKFKPDLPSILTFLGGVLSLAGGIWMTMLEDPTSGYLLPMILIMLGGLLTLSSAYWASIQGNKDKNVIIELQKKNIELNNQALNQITGGDTWCYLSGMLIGSRDGDKLTNYPSYFSIQVEGKIPLYDLSIRIYSINHYATERKHYFSEKIGTLTKSLHQDQFIQFKLPDRKRVDYLIQFTSRNGEITQHLIFLKNDENLWFKATKVFRHKYIGDESFRKEELFELVDPNFPEKEIKWVDF